MSRFFPHAPYAEDQPLSKTILTTHVLYRGFQSGALLGLAAGAARTLFARTPRPALAHALARSAATGATAGTALLAVALAARMQGRADIEWSDRSWRLLENAGQLEVDDWSGVGAVVGGVAAPAVRALRGLGVRAVVGGAGVGSLAGTAGYMAWRYGVHGGRR